MLKTAQPILRSCCYIIKVSERDAPMLEVKSRCRPVDVVLIVYVCVCMCLGLLTSTLYSGDHWLKLNDRRTDDEKERDRRLEAEP